MGERRRLGLAGRRGHEDQAEAHLVGGPVAPRDEVGGDLAQDGELLFAGGVVGAGDADGVARPTGTGLARS